MTVEARSSFSDSGIMLAHITDGLHKACCTLRRLQIRDLPRSLVDTSHRSTWSIYATAWLQPISRRHKYDDLNLIWVDGCVDQRVYMMFKVEAQWRLYKEGVESKCLTLKSFTFCHSKALILYWSFFWRLATMTILPGAFPDNISPEVKALFEEYFHLSNAASSHNDHDASSYYVNLLAITTKDKIQMNKNLLSSLLMMACTSLPKCRTKVMKVR